ncbi:hypothetical protein CDL15_Pgr008533 [Punica granatum]|uniref:Uncharacterized protein n=1 Tax=Punica granatum TaxID=22663 RepID=A0A218WPC6_PUNGR|nr:hypothetical protein CDL15_Pgr008533 [Punica granatum]
MRVELERDFTVAKPNKMLQAIARARMRKRLLENTFLTNLGCWKIGLFLKSHDVVAGLEGEWSQTRERQRRGGGELDGGEVGEEEGTATAPLRPPIRRQRRHYRHCLTALVGQNVGAVMFVVAPRVIGRRPHCHRSNQRGRMRNHRREGEIAIIHTTLDRRGGGRGPVRPPNTVSIVSFAKFES